MTRLKQRYPDHTPIPQGFLPVRNSGPSLTTPRLTNPLIRFQDRPGQSLCPPLPQTTPAKTPKLFLLHVPWLPISKQSP